MPIKQGAEKPTWPVSYIPRVVLKFHEKSIHSGGEDDDVNRFLHELTVGSQWRELISQFPGITIQRAIISITPSRVRELVKEGRTVTPEYRPPNFLTYFAIPCPSKVNPQAVVQSLRKWETVEVAYIESGPSLPPATNPADDLPGWSMWETDFLAAAPRGIDAEYAWTIPGGDGSSAASANGLQVVDIEEGWTIPTDGLPDASPPIPTIADYHEDLNPNAPPARIQLVHGANRDFFGHGTAVLGIIRAVDNALGTIGVVPNVATTMVASIWPTNRANSTDRVNAIWAANSRLNFGDVLLLETQSDWVLGSYRRGPSQWYLNLPIEIEKSVFDAIKACTSRGIVVIEAAGNGNIDLDDFIPDASSYPTWGQDSGAIIVAAAASPGDPNRPAPNPPPRSPLANITNRSRSMIHCYAWGEDIYTTGDGYQGSGKQDYVPGFGGTSGASAIIAGAALAVQGVCKANLNKRLDPLDKAGIPGLRTILSDPTRSSANDPRTGNTLSATSTYIPADPTQWNADKIGVMPNLKAIIDRLIQSIPPSAPTGLIIS